VAQYISSVQLTCYLEAEQIDCFPADVPSAATFLIGYFKPPNNIKRWIVEERDLKMTYSLCDPGSKVILWCETKVKNENENNMPFVAKNEKNT